MTITKRQAEILNKIVRNYIDLAQPVSSEFLEKRHNLGICPATIRIEMQKLTDRGFLFQPHTSAGRVPTDKGYRFFVDNLLKEEISEFKDSFKVEEILREEKEDILKWASRLTKFLAEESSNFVILDLLERDFLFKEGWEEILEEPEFEEKDLVFDFVGFLENFEKNIEDLKINSGIKICIGKENPFPKARNFSIISSRCYFPDEKERGIISLLGLKRMDYDRNISLINSLTKLLEKL
jgi:transcriptional regulator of heat shock response